MFRDALEGLEHGDFSRLEPFFVAEQAAGRPLIIDWYEEGRFNSEPDALAEALTCACFLGRIDVAEFILNKGVDPSGGMKTGLNAFHWAANRAQLEAVRLLIRWKAPSEPRSMYGGNVVETAIWSAINEPKPDHIQIIRELFEAGARPQEPAYPTGHERVDAILREYSAGDE